MVHRRRFNGLISLLPGFALNADHIAHWLAVYRAGALSTGDRIQLESFTGDVVEINYLDTTLWEFAGDYLTNDLPSGRLTSFSNSLVFDYSWRKFPFIWNEIPFHVAYESDLQFVEKTLREVTKNEPGPGNGRTCA